MDKDFAQKLISKAIILTIISTFILPINTHAANLNWDTPNSGSNPYKFKISDSLNSDLVMRVVGCTGVVNKVSSAVTGFVSNEANKVIENLKARAKEKAARAALNASGITAGASITSPGSGIGEVIGKSLIEQGGDITVKQTEDATSAEKSDAIKKELQNQSKTEQCLNGIAYTLAKNQLTAMTKSAMNWITTGFNGDPMYVQNATSFMNNITDNILEKEVSLFQGDTNSYPYGNSYAIGAINSNNYQRNFYTSMKQNLTYYLSSGKAGDDAATVLEDYSNNFGMGGWNGWLAFTQQPQNNPLGYSMKMSDYIAQKQNAEITEKKEELARNKGILDQKKCIKYATSKAKGGAAIGKALVNYDSDEYNEKITNASDEVTFAQDDYDKAVKALALDPNNKDKKALAKSTLETLEKAKKAYEKLLADKSSVDSTVLTVDGDECESWQVVTPGSLIQEKISNYLTSDTRQLELADSINEVLNSLFSKLINSLQHNGLSSLSSDSDEFEDTSSGSGTNRVYDYEGNDVTDQTSSSGFTGPFDITKDLGNTYTTPTYAGDWDASINVTTNTTEGYLSKGLGTKNTFYIVTVAGNKSLFDGNTSWKVGEKAFFDGENWRKGIPNYVIAQKGIIQNQQDYINNAQKVLKILPQVMPAIGELDYCIPGPNPSWQANTADAYSSYSEWLYAISPDVKAKAFLKRASTVIVVPETSSTTYKNYRAIFEGDKGSVLWPKILNSSFFNSNPATDWEHPFNRQHGDNKKWKGNANMAAAQERINTGVQVWVDFLDKNTKSYFVAFNNKYGSQSPMNNYTSGKYLEMAQSGTEITKNITQYDEKVTESTTTYQDNIKTSCLNIYKLNKIKDEVNVIVKAAQKRRDDERKAKGETAVSASCETAELGTYIVDDKPLSKGCGNADIDESDEVKKAKALEETRKAEDAANRQIDETTKQLIDQQYDSTDYADY